MIFLIYLPFFLKASLLEGGWEYFWWWNDEPDRSALTEAEVVMFKKAMEYVLKKGSSLDCESFKEWWDFFRIRTRVLDILERGHLQLRPINIYEVSKRWKELWFVHSKNRFIDWVLRKTSKRHLDILDFFRASAILNTRMKQEEDLWIKRIRGKSISGKLKFLKRFPLVYSEEILKTYLNIDLCQVSLTENGTLDGEFVELICLLYIHSTSLGDMLDLNNFLKKIQNHFHGYLGVRDQCAKMLTEYESLIKKYYDF